MPKAVTDKLTSFGSESGKSVLISDPNMAQSGAERSIPGHSSEVFVAPGYDLKLTCQYLRELGII